MATALPPTAPAVAKDTVPLSAVPSTSSAVPTGMFSPVTNFYNKLQSWRQSLELPNPGTVENLQKEVKSTLLNNFFFDGARADLTKGLSMNPQFSVTHSFALGSQTMPPSYSFGAVYATESTLLQGNVDNEGSLSGRYHSNWNPANMTKVQMQVSNTPGHSILQAEHDYLGRDFCVNLRAANPSPADFIGMYSGSIMQSVTKNVAIGVEALLQRPQPGLSDRGLQYFAKYTSSNFSKEQGWIATATVQPQGMYEATYWQKMSEKLDVAAQLQIINVPQRRDAIATLGAKWDLRMATFRAQLDSSGKVSALLEQRFAPSFAFLFSGEIDHFKNSAKVGVGVMIESSSMTPEEMGMVPPPGYPYPQ
uniref:Mitochondrial import receptor subunit TOM40 n=1 Tax=Zea mays TaxID=4577 RepID=B6SQM4_MAIZE|nr:mitochondrial import receptor subunit TOM40 [Zea mays]